MAAQRPKSRSLRRLSASSRARRERRAAAHRRLTYLGSAAGVAIVLAAPLSIASFMGMESSIPGFDSAKSFLAMMTDRSPGSRTKGELNKTKQRRLPDVPEQRALGKITKPAPPKEFVEAISPTVPKAVEEFAPAVAGLGPLLVTPTPPAGGGGIILPPQAPPPGGGGGTPPGGGGTPPGGGTTPPEQPPDTPTTPPEQPPNHPPDHPPDHPPVVPEPGTWVTMLFGFGLTGLMMRRRRRTATRPIYG